MQDVLKLSLCAAQTMLEEKKVSSEELTKACLARIEETADWNNFITVCGDAAL